MVKLMSRLPLRITWLSVSCTKELPEEIRIAEGDLRAGNAALYLFCENDLPYVADPMRSYPTEEGRRMCRDLWQRTLEELGVGYVLIHGPGEERLARAIRAVEDLLKD